MLGRDPAFDVDARRFEHPPITNADPMAPMLFKKVLRFTIISVI
jgi:hypothetical protein